jgi:hypothetical protein
MNEGEQNAFIQSLRAEKDRQDEIDYQHMLHLRSLEVEQHRFCIFKNGAETIVCLNNMEYYANYNGSSKTPQLTPRAQALQKMQERYLFNKKKQEDQKFAEASCFRFWATKRLALTKDVINFICRIITDRAYDPKIAVDLPAVQEIRKEKEKEKEKEQEETSGMTWDDPHTGITYNVKIRNITFVKR